MNETAAAKESNGNGKGPDTPQFMLQKIYVKDMSFEAPNAPHVFIDGDVNQADTQFQVNLKNSHTDLPENNCEVVLNVSVHATVKDRTLFMVEVDQAGIFIIKGYGAEDRQTLLGTHCATTLFPYVREAISSAVTRGGFPAMLLQPMNFDALFAQAMQEQAARA